MIIEIKKMAKKCIYCGAEIDDTSVIDFCRKCGIGVFGQKMFEAIVHNMEEARDKGDLMYMRMDPKGFSEDITKF
jgi:hypothetical protein